MKHHSMFRHRLSNLGQALLLLLGLLGLLGGVGYLLAGLPGLVGVLITAGVVAILSPALSPVLVLHLFGAKRLSVREAPTLYALAQTLAARAELPAVPQIYYIPSRALNAFTVGRRRHAAIAVTDGLIRGLNAREMAGVFAHEIAHIRHHDLRVLSFADAVGRLTAGLAWVGLILLAVNFVMWLMGAATIPWTVVLLLVFAPTLVGVLQLMLSRSREYDADLEAVRLTGDPIGLIHALRKFELVEFHWIERLVLGGHRAQEPSLLRTHPSTDDRIRRLRPMSSTRTPMEDVPFYADLNIPASRPFVSRLPCWHWTGLWY